MDSNSIKDFSDSDLVESFLGSGGRGVRHFNEIVRRYEPQVHGFALKYFRNQELASEVSQEVFLKVYGKLETLNNRSQLRAWILRITQNICSNFYQKNVRRNQLMEKVRGDLELKDEVVDHTDVVEKKLEFLRACLEKFKTAGKEIIMLHYFSEMSVRDISKMLELSESAVKMRLVRGRDILKNCVKKKM